MKKLLFIAFMVALAGGFTSCQKDSAPSEQQIKEQIGGKWRVVYLNGEEILTDNASVETYGSAGKMTFTVFSPENDAWLDHEAGWYSLSGNTLTSLGYGDYVRSLAIGGIDGSTLEGDNTITDEEGKAVVSNRAKYTRVSVDYSTDILGTWEGVEMTGEETEGDVDHRWKYNEDGTYVYYNKVGGIWVPEILEEDEYCVDGDFLVFRWKGLLEKDYNVECWIITGCTEDEMTWYALRGKEDGSRYTTTVKMKKVTGTLVK